MLLMSYAFPADVCASTSLPRNPRSSRCKRWQAGQRRNSTQDYKRTTTITLKDLPVELVQHILFFVLPHSVLSFALTCRWNHRVALPALYHRVVLAGSPALHRFVAAEVAGSSVLLNAVRHLKLSAGPDQVIERKSHQPPSRWAWSEDLARLLYALPGLQSFDAVCTDWALDASISLWTLLQMLPDTLRSLRAVVPLYSGGIQQKLWASDAVSTSHIV